ncbi:MAG TPA: DUF1579 family protein [Candidatus Acidoferrales bacterium]|nr:DUF1579 family protein [Candidatus Acidoferrales bacterium]
MLKQMGFVTALCAFLAAAGAAPLFAQAHAGAVGAQQGFLAKRAGNYTRVIRFVGQPGEWKGTSKISVILGGRFIMEENHDTVFGRPVEGIRILGYDDASKHYEMISMYTMSTGITKFTGTSDDGGRTVDYSAMSSEPQGQVPLHALIRQMNDSEFVVTLSTRGVNGKFKPFQETTYTRVK